MTNYFKKVVPAVLAATLTLGAWTVSTAAQSTAKAQGGSMAASSAAAHQIDINSASKADLSSLPGIGDVYSQKIIDGRPYHAKTDLKTKGILPAGVYSKISAMIIAKQSTAK
jgi:DNA uptake protein ComE-like DNA-binding protein